MNGSSEKASGGARGAILDAAEELFARSGFDGVPVREIAKHANVGLSLVTYHFASKEQLFEEVFARRSEDVGAMRRKLLGEFTRSGGKDLRTLVEAFTRPFLHFMTSGDDGWKNYGELVAQVAQSPKQAAMVNKYYDDTARQFTNELDRLFGFEKSERSVRALVLSISVMLSVFSSIRRVESLSGGRFSSTDLGASYPLMLDFICGGIERVMSNPDEG